MFSLSTIIVMIIVAAIACIILLVAVAKRYKRCPPDKIMVISGKVGKGPDGEARSSICLHGGAKFVWPIIQDVQFLDLTPLSIGIDLSNALSRQNIRVNVPATFTVGISTDEDIMQNAAERLLGQPLRAIETLGKEIIYGQLRLVIAQMDIEELNSKRDEFMRNVSDNVEEELKKVGLRLINANITDISDESGYIEALGKEAEAKAINEAKITVAERTRQGNTGEKNEKAAEAIAIAEKDAEQREGVAAQITRALTAEKEAETAQRAKIAENNARAVAAEKQAETAQRTKIAEMNAQAIAAEKQAETAQRAKVAEMNAQAIAAENNAKANIALSESKRLEVEAAAQARAVAAEKVAKAQALAEAYAAEEKAELARAARAKASLQADVIVKADVEKQRLEIAAEAEAEAIRRKAKGQADAILAKMEAEAEGMKQQLAKRAEAYTMLVRAAGNNSDAAVRLMMADKVEDILKIQVDAVKNINFGKITVWDSMSGQDGASTTSNFLNSMMKSIPPMKDVYDMIGVEMPAGLGKDKETKSASVSTKPSIGVTSK